MCSNILSLYQKVNPFYTQKFYNNQPQVTGTLLIYVKEVIKTVNRFFREN